MKVDLAEHVVTRLQVFLDRIKSTRLYVDSIHRLVDCERVDDPLQIVDPVLRAGHE